MLRPANSAGAAPVVVPRDLEGVMALAQRLGDLLEPAGRAVRLEEERAVAVVVREQHLVGQPSHDRHAEHLGVEALRPRQVGDVHPEMIEPPNPHAARIPRLLDGGSSLPVATAAIRSAGSGRPDAAAHPAWAWAGAAAACPCRAFCSCSRSSSTGLPLSASLLSCFTWCVIAGSFRHSPARAVACARSVVCGCPRMVQPMCRQQPDCKTLLTGGASPRRRASAQAAACRMRPSGCAARGAAPAPRGAARHGSPSTIAAFRRRPARFVAVIAEPRNRLRNASSSIASKASSVPNDPDGPRAGS